jgi:outer membrane cobalamin receptor
VQLTAGDTERVSFSLERNTTTLDTVVVAGKAVPSRLDDFETRYRNHLASSAFNRDDIVKVNPIDTWQMLSRVPSLKFINAGSPLIAVSNRGMKIDRTMQAVPCVMSVMIDGIRMGGADGNFDLTRLPPPEDIHGIEVFAGPSSIPPQYGGAGNNKMCGLIAIWTR